MAYFGTVEFSNGIVVDYDLIHDCALEALKVIEKRLPGRLFCVDVCNQIADDMREIARTSTLSIAQKFPEENTIAKKPLGNS